MSKKRFIVRKRLSLDFFGEDWQDCFIEFTPITYKEANELANLGETNAENLSNEQREKLAKQTLQLLKDHFISGKGYTEAGVVELEADDIEQMPVEIIGKAIGQLRGEIDPKLAAGSES